MPLNPHAAKAAEALESMGFEDWSEFEPGHGLLGYWQPVAPYTKVVFQDHPLVELRHLRDSILRQLDTDAQRNLFLELTGW